MKTQPNDEQREWFKADSLSIFNACLLPFSASCRPEPQHDFGCVLML